MKKYVIISSNSNPDYEWYLPLVKWAWNKLGWEVVCLRPFKSDIYREETITQCIRLYAALLPQFEPCDMLMTSDADMVPLSDYWKPHPGTITTYGHDLTNYNHVPICYVAMSVANWRDVMRLETNIESDMLRDLENSAALSSVKHGDNIGWWSVDQDIITERLKHHSFVNVHRGIEPGSPYPTGRVDRSAPNFMPSTLIDYHGPRETWNHIDKIREVIIKAFGECPPL